MSEHDGNPAPIATGAGIEDEEDLSDVLDAPDEVDRGQGRVRRKVKAATTGAGAIGFVPVLLQLVGVLHLDPELAATISTGAAILGALAAGWATPERQAVVSKTPAVQSLLE